MLFPLIVTFIFLAACLPFVALPLRRDAPVTLAAAPVAPTAGAPPRYATVLLALRDLEFDHDLGVVADDDYAGLHAQLMAEAASALERNQKQKEDTAAASIEDAVRALRQQRRIVTRYCPQCGRSVNSGDRFCSGCGVTLT